MDDLNNELAKDCIIKDGYLLFWNSIFSQWYPSKFIENNQIFYNAEHYMMFHKALHFKDYKILELIKKEVYPSTIKSLGRQVKGFDDESWDLVKEQIVINGNLLKFKQNINLYNFLMSSKLDNIVFVETSPYDKVWGIGMYNTDSRCTQPHLWLGENLLGNCLNEVRRLLINI